MRKRKITALISVSAALILATVGTVAGIKMYNQKNAYLTVDGDTVSEDELKFYISAYRAEAIRHFTADLKQTAPNEFFWKTENNGVTPAEYLSGLAEQALRSDRALFDECARRGICEKLDYEAVVKEMKAENADRAEKLKRGEPVYGVTSYTVTTYYDYLKSNLKIALREQLEKEGFFNADELSLKKYYNQIRDTDPLFKDGSGEYKAYGDVMEKVKYLYREKCYSDFIEQLKTKQKITKNDRKLEALAAATD